MNYYEFYDFIFRFILFNTSGFFLAEIGMLEPDPIALLSDIWADFESIRVNYSVKGNIFDFSCGTHAHSLGFLVTSV
jgi:hypothetical protein